MNWNAAVAVKGTLFALPMEMQPPPIVGSTTRDGSSMRDVPAAPAAAVVKSNGCCVCCCNTCSCCLRPMLGAALQLLQPEIDLLVAAKVEAQHRGPGAPTSKMMARDGITIPAAPPLEKYREWLLAKAPKAPPMELFHTWVRNKAAITIQTRFKSSTYVLARYVRRKLAEMPDEVRAPAIAPGAGLDDIRHVIQTVLGTNVFSRAVYNAPNTWEEAQMVSALQDVLATKGSQYLFLLTRPSKFERALLDLSSGVAFTQEAKREVAAAMRIQKIFRGRSKRLAVMLRFALEGIPREISAAAVNQGLDAIGALLSDRLGKNVWARAVRNAPDDWEEEQMVFAIGDIFSRPATSGYVWLLAKPTKYEQMLATAFTSGAKAFNARL